MNHTSILFQFEDLTSAESAFDMLDELGYEPILHDQSANSSEKPKLHIHVERRDLTSALEIAQFYRGKLIESPSNGEKARNPGDPERLINADGFQNSNDPEQLINVDEIRIPAHTVNEDWLDSAF